MNIFHPDQTVWLAQVEEAAIEPERRIIDPHHHLWPDMRGDIYNVDEYTRDTGSGHNVVGSVFMECGTCYDRSLPEAEQSLGETAYVLDQAARVASEGLATPILAMVGHVDLRLTQQLDELLDKHHALAGDFFKGIRHAGASAREADVPHMLIPGAAPADLYLQGDFQQGVRRLGQRGLSYDTWHYHYQMRDFMELARACPDTQLVLDHFGTPLGVGSFEGKREEHFAAWQDDLRALSECPNVALKLGGLVMPDNGFGWHTRKLPPGSDEFVSAQGDYYHHALDCFGSQRCMFESNFPVDRMSISYGVLYNGFKKLVAGASEDEKDALFYGNAKRIYRLS